MFKSTVFLGALALIVFHSSFGQALGGGTISNLGKTAEVLKKLIDEKKVVIENHMSEQISLKCASGDDDLGWQTLEKEQVFGWGFKSHVGGRTCFWCYVNHNGRGHRDSGNWYMHFNVWGFNDCPNAASQGKITIIGIKNDGAYYGGRRLSSWGPPPGK